MDLGQGVGEGDGGAFAWLLLFDVAQLHGGALYFSHKYTEERVEMGMRLAMAGCDVLSNHAARSGGGCYAVADVALESSRFFFNMAGLEGGALFHSGYDLTCVAADTAPQRLI